MPSYKSPTSPLFNVVDTIHTLPTTRPTSHSFSLQRPHLTNDVKKTRNAKRLSLVVPPSPGMLESLAALSTPSFPPASASLSSRRPLPPASRMPTIASSTATTHSTTDASETPGSSSAADSTTDATTTHRRHSQFLLENALPSSPRFPTTTNTSKARRPISAYFSDFSVECGTASPYTSEPVCILPYLYLGAEHNASDTTTLSRLGINHVLNVAIEITQQSKADAIASAAELNNQSSPFVEKNHHLNPHSHHGIQYHHLSWTHHQKNLSTEFPEAFDYIDLARRNGGKILVHCQLGVSRSASLVIAYVMEAEKKSLTEAYDYVKDRSSVISPNMSLMYQLSEFEQSLRAEAVAKAGAGTTRLGTGVRTGARTLGGNVNYPTSKTKRDSHTFDQEEPLQCVFPSEEEMDIDGEHSFRSDTASSVTAPSSKRNSLVLNLHQSNNIGSGPLNAGPSHSTTHDQKMTKPLTRPRSTYRHTLMGVEAAASVASATGMVPRTPLTDRFSFDRTALAYPPLSAINNNNHLNDSSSRLTTVEASPTSPSFATDFATLGGTPLSESCSTAPSSSASSMFSRPSSTSSYATTLSNRSTATTAEMPSYAALQVMHQKVVATPMLSSTPASKMTAAPAALPRRESSKGALDAALDLDSVISPRRSGSWTLMGSQNTTTAAPSHWAASNPTATTISIATTNNTAVSTITGSQRQRRSHRLSLTFQMPPSLEGGIYNNATSTVTDNVMIKTAVDA
ncbi:hypothetical protein BGZ94_000807, partial [Podila epigama]